MIGSISHHEKVFTSSSMDVAAKNIDSLEHGTLLTADKHTIAYGRRKRTWEIMPGQLLLTYVIKPDIPSEPESHNNITHLNALFMAWSIALQETFYPFTGSKIKWPNDLIIGQKKIAGMIFKPVWQGESFHGIVVGIGINVTNTFSEENPLSESATSVLDATGMRMHPDDIMHMFHSHINRWYQIWTYREYKNIFREWNRHMGLKGQSITIHDSLGKSSVGTFFGTASNGDLVLAKKDGSFSEISLSQVSEISAV